MLGFSRKKDETFDKFYTQETNWCCAPEVCFKNWKTRKIEQLSNEALKKLFKKCDKCFFSGETKWVWERITRWNIATEYYTRWLGK